MLKNKLNIYLVILVIVSTSVNLWCTWTSNSKVLKLFLCIVCIIGWGMYTYETIKSKKEKVIIAKNSTKKASRYGMLFV